MSTAYLFNNDRVIDCPKFEEGKPFDWTAFKDGTGIKKIVLGQLGDEGKKEPLPLPAWPSDFATRFPNLTHLYVWNCTGFTSLPPLPTGLQCLDVRGCKELTQLPALPMTLDTLDLGDCVGLATLTATTLPALERFYFNGCVKLKSRHVEGFLEANLSSPLVEIDGSGTMAVMSLEEFPRQRLRKLVLKDCTKFADARDIAEFTALDHLNLAGCTALKSLPDLPPEIRYLELFGCEALKDFMGQDVGPYDRGTKSGLRQNVAKVFHSRKKFGGDLAIMPHAKLLLMGDGRVGKSTLAKRLLWDELSADARKNPQNETLKPSADEPFTHKVRFWPWSTGLSLPEEEMAVLDERAVAAKVSLPKTANGLLDGAVRILDFGGQEIYHHTHRIFAGEGSIFLLVWRENEPVAGDAPGDVTSDEWAEWNRSRPLDYWLDYIYSMRPNASVALVCTHCTRPDQMTSKPDWKARAPKHAKRELPSFHVDSLDEGCGSHKEYARLVDWIRVACGKEAQRIGILQPRFYRQVSDLLDRWLAENSQNRYDGGVAKYLLMSWRNWKKSVCDAHGASSAMALTDDDINAITGYLHEAGHLFAIRHAEERAVLVDQEWATELIYRLLLPGGSLWAKVKRNGGWFYRADLENDDLWKGLEGDLQRERLLAYMQDSRIVTCIAPANKNRLRQDVFLASDKWLLPTFEQVKTQVERQMKRLCECGNVEEQQKFEFEAPALSELDFRTLQAQLARSFGTQAVYFRNGFQAIDEAQPPAWCFRVRWHQKGKDPFAGHIDAVLSAQKGRLADIATEIEGLFYGSGSPLGEPAISVKRTPQDGLDFGQEFFGARRAEKFDVALSSSGADKMEAEALVAALKAAGIRVKHYLLPECRTEEYAAVLKFMASMSEQPCIVLLLSAGYLNDDPAKNWYCAWELADAVLQLASTKRTAAQTVVIYKKSEDFDSTKLNEMTVPLLTSMAQHFDQLYSSKPTAQKKNFKYYHDIMHHFQNAVEGDKCAKLFQERGAGGVYPAIKTNSDGSKDYSAVVDAVQRGLGKKSLS